MKQYNYLFGESSDWQALVNACIPLDNHEQSPSVHILCVLISNLHEPQAMLDGSMTAELVNYLNGSEYLDKIMNCAVTLYVNMISELTAMNLNHGTSYFLISADIHVLVGIYLPVIR